MSCCSRRGEAEDSIELARDVQLVRMRRAGLSWRWLAAFFKTPASTLRCRYEGMDPGVRAAYEGTPLDFIGLDDPAIFAHRRKIP